MLAVMMWGVGVIMQAWKMPENVLPDEFVKSGLEILGGIYLEVMETDRKLKQAGTAK